MFKKIIALLIAISCFVLLAVPVSAIDATYSVNDFITDTYVDGANDIMSVVVPYKYNAWSRIYKNVTSGQIYGAAIYDVMLQDDPNVETTDPAVFDLVVSYNPLGVNGAESYFDIATMPSSTVFTLQNVVIIAMAQSTEFRTNMVQEFSVQYYDVNGEYLGTQKMDFTRVWTPEKVGIVTYDMGDITFKLDKPAGAKYGKFRMLLKFESLYFARQYSALTIDIDNFMFQMSIVDAERELLQENQDLLNEVKNQLKEQQAVEKENGEKLDGIIDSLEKAPEKEQNAAADGGNKNVGEILDVIPNESQGFMNALSSFSQAFSYEGTDAILPIPAIRLPEIPGVIPSFTILESQDFDLGAFVNFLPEGLVVLVQSLLTIALIVYCFKELYDTIAYVMTLRKGE